MSGALAVRAAVPSLYSPLKPPNPTWNSSAVALFPIRPKSFTTFTCSCSFTPGGPSPADPIRLRLRPSCCLFSENESKNILDAFFLGKALAEAVTERIESTVGEFLSTVGRLQAEQQKQVQDFQEEVLERAKQAKEKAARETMETQGLIPNSSATDTSASSRVTSPRTNINSQPADINSEDGSEDSKLGISDGE